MERIAVIVWVYGALVLVGGVMGWIKAQSKPSLMSGVGFGVALLFSGWFIWQGDRHALLGTAVLAGVLLIVMGIRFGATSKFMPAGLVAGLSLVVLVLLLLAMKG